MEHKEESPTEAIGGAKEDRGADYRLDDGESKAVSLVEAALAYAQSGLFVFPAPRGRRSRSSPLPTPTGHVGEPRAMRMKSAMTSRAGRTPTSVSSPGRRAASSWWRPIPRLATALTA